MAMRLQLKVPRGLTSSLTTATSVRRSAVFSSPRPPDGPSCSRWISCSCCRQQIETPFFSGNHRQTRTRTPPKETTLVEAVAAADNLPISKPSRPQLPLPPTLPYSPDSLPFQRHLQHLSLAVLSPDPDESWRTYLALHGSLRRYIPDDLFRSLLSHQLSSPHAKQSWVRGLALIKFARRCGVEVRYLGEENLRNALRSGFDLVLRTKVSDLKEYLGDLKSLWAQMVQTSKSVPIDLRKSYLRLHTKRIAKNKDQRFDNAEQALREVVERYGVEGIEREAGKIVSLYAGSDESIHTQSLRLAAWCAEQGLELSDDTFLIMLRLHETWFSPGQDALVKLRLSLDSIETSPVGLDFLNSVFADIEHRYRSPAQRIAGAMTAFTPELIRRTLDVLATDKPDFVAVLNALSVLARREAEVSVIVTAALDHLDSHPSPDNLISLIRLLLQAKLLDKIRPDHLRHMLQLLVLALPSESAYVLCRKVYSAARQRGYRWTHPERTRWHILFHHAVHKTRRHLHFASRLYADLQSDGQAIRRNDHLAFIRAIGMSRSASSPILLQRHIDDFIQSSNSVSPNSFVLALVTGLTSSKSAQDASIAYDLSRQILRDRPFPRSAAQLLVPRLSASANLVHLRKAVHLLEDSPTAEACNHVIFSIVAHSKPDARAGQMSRSEALSQAVGMYKRMQSRDISATPRTVSLLLRALVEARYVDAAIDVFSAAVKNGIVLKANAVGRLIVRLTLDNDLDRAAEIEAKWREVSTSVSASGKTYDQAIVGARVLLDLKRGFEVDLEEIAKKTGWTGTAPFLRFIETLKPHAITETRSRSQIEHQQDDVVVGAGAESIRDSHDHESASVRPAAMDSGDRPRRPWIRSDNIGRGFEADSMIAVRAV